MIDPTPFLLPVARARATALARQDAVAAQRLVLRSLVRRAAATRFGRAHGFDAIDGVAAFQAAVPLRDWAAFSRDWWNADFPVLRNVSWPGRVPFFAETSGTVSARTKHIPVTRAAMRSNRRAALDVTFHHLARRGASSSFFDGPSLILGGSTALTTLRGGARAGDLSGIAAATVPPFARGRTLPSRDTALLAAWDRKLDRVVAEAAGRKLRSISGTTSWLLILFERLLAASGHDRLDRAFPTLELVVHGGVGFAPYRDAFARLVGPGIARAEVYAASEGFFAMSDGTGEDEAMRLVVDNGVFYEFVPPEELDRERPTRHTVADAIVGRDYALVVSTNAGLFGYVVGDVVRLVGRDGPRLVVTGRTGHTLSAFGEHVSGGELDRAIAAAADTCGVAVSDYTATIVPPDQRDGRGGHLFIVETDGSPDPGAFAAAIDRTLASGNDDYRAHRAGDRGMRPPAVRVVPPGTFAAWLRRRGRIGGQVKVPRVLVDPAAARGLGNEE